MQDLQELPLFLSSKAIMEMPHVSESETPCLDVVGKSKESLVSATLCLYDESWPKEGKNITHEPKVSWGPRDNKLTEEKRNIAQMMFLSNEERKEEERYGVSTKLSLFTDPWVFEKKLTIRDLDRLLLGASPVHSHILRYLPEDNQRMVQNGYGVMIIVYDHDTDSTHKLLLRKKIKARTYVLDGGWRVDFVHRRALKKNDEIGVFWDRFDSKLHFSVLSRAPMELASSSATN